MQYNYELTDTFGGEPNYCWVRRGTVEAKNLTGAIRKFMKAEMKPRTPHKTWRKDAWTAEVDFPRFNMRAFIESAS